MNDYSLYAPSNRKKLLSSAIGQELIEIRRYYSLTEMPENHALTFDQMSKGSNLITLIFKNGIEIDLSAYAPRYVEAKRALHPKYKYAVSPNRAKNRYPILVYKIDQYKSSLLSDNSFHEVLNKKVKDIGLLV